jgi:hypothetical protein
VETVTDQLDKNPLIPRRRRSEFLTASDRDRCRRLGQDAVTRPTLRGTHNRVIRECLGETKSPLQIPGN